MIMRNAYLSGFKEKQVGVRVQVISSAMLDALMSSPNVLDSNNKSPVKDEFNLIPVLTTSGKTHLSSGDKTSVLRFKPSQIHRVHKTRKDDNHKGFLKRKTYYTPIVEALEACGSREHHGKSLSKSSSSKGSEAVGKPSLGDTSQEPSKSPHTSERESDSSVSTCSFKKEYSHSPSRSSVINGRNSVTNRKSSTSAFKSDSTKRKSESSSESDSDESQNSSIYATPKGTSSSMKSAEAEERHHSRFKRSLSDECSNEGNSANSSFNNSGYYTPESSPSNFHYVKRPKIRWSDSSALNHDNSSYSSLKHNTSVSSEQGIQPDLIGYQMVGDSQFCRFGQQLLGLARVPMPNCPGRIGICVSGQTITDLHRRVKDNFYPISDKIILMIGTNDFLRNVNVSTMCAELSALIKTLQKSASNIILLTLPPIPKLEKKVNTEHFRLLEVYNSHIRSLENGETLRIADISPFYMTQPPYQRCRMHLFEVFFNGPAKRLDLIHLNRLGLEVIRNYILDKFL